MWASTFLKWCQVFHVQRGGSTPPVGSVNFQARQAVQQTIGSGQFRVNFDTVVFDHGGYFNVSNGRYTPLIPGVYSFSSQIVLTAPDNTSGRVRAIMYNPDSSGSLISVTPFIDLISGQVPILPLLSPNLNFNGTTDGLSVYVQTAAYTGTPLMIDNSTYSTYFQGFLTK